MNKAKPFERWGRKATDLPLKKKDRRVALKISLTVRINTKGKR